MNCNKFEFLISQYIDNEITKEDSIILEKHLKQCSKCCKTLKCFKNNRTILLNSKLSTIINDVENKISEKIKHIQEQKTKKKNIVLVDFVKKHFVLAASFLFIVVSSLTLWQTSIKVNEKAEQVDLSWYYECEDIDITTNYGYDLVYFDDFCC